MWTGDNWESNKRPGKDFFVELLELRLSNTNVVTSRIGQLKTPLVAISLCRFWFNIKEDFNLVSSCCPAQSKSYITALS